MTSKLTPPNDVGPKVARPRTMDRIQADGPKVQTNIALTAELRRVYRELHFKMCGDLGYYVPITECPHPTCSEARRFLGLPAQPLDKWASQPSAPRNISGDTEDDLGLPDLRVRGRAE